MTNDSRLHVPDWNDNATLSRLLAGQQGILSWTEARHGDGFVQRVLKEVHDGRKYLSCKCCEKAPKLYVAKHPNAYRLSRYPMTGHLHASHCYFYDRKHTSSSSENVEISGDVVRLSLGRRVFVPVEGEGSEVKQTRTSHGKSYARQRLLGLFRALWESAGLNVYDPGLRMNWSVVRNALEARAQLMRWAGAPFSNSLVIPIPPSMTDKREAEISSDRAKLEVCAREQTRIVLVAPVRGWLRPKNAKGKDHAVIDLAINAPVRRSYGQNPYSMRVVMGSAVFNRLAFSYSRAFAPVSVRLKEEGARSSTLDADPKMKAVLIAICKVQMSDDGVFTLAAEDAAMDVLTRDFIPCDSSYEVELARALAINGRQYRKPLIESEWENMLPDFELLDVASASAPLEVFGFSTDAYLVAKSRKIATYVKSGRTFWYWDPVADGGQPLEAVFHQLPPRAK
tara:strand:+ start:4822 stop:6180 length:1359 start_codon:yes stop_codon:yes gene_type:complete